MPLRKVFHPWDRFSFIPTALRWLYFSSTFESFGSAFLLLVSPVFLYQIGQNLQIWNSIPWLFSDFQKGLLVVLFYYFMICFFYLLLVKPLTILYTKQSLHLWMILGQASYFLSVVLIPLVPNWPLVLLLITFLRALGAQWYWTTYYILLAADIDLDKTGNELASLELLRKLATLLAPLIGALLSITTGFNSAFWVGSLFYFLSMLTLFQLPTLRIRTSWQWRDWFEAWKNNKGRNQIIGIAGHSWEAAGIAIIWPLFLFIFLKNIVEVGYIFTAASLLSMFLIYLSGWVFDHKNRRNWSLESGSVLVFLWIGRAFSLQLPFLAFAIEGVDKVMNSMYQTFFSSMLVLRARANNAVIYATNRKVTQFVANGTGWLILALATIAGLPPAIIMSTFLLGSIASLRFVTDQRIKYRE